MYASHQPSTMNRIQSLMSRKSHVSRFHFQLNVVQYICSMELVYSLNEIKDAATQFWHLVNDKKVFAFNGSMGAGKTTFINALCQVLQVNSTVSSPTFSIINDYEYPGGEIFHIDLYRLKDEEEALRAGVEDCLYSGNICFIEWPQKAKNILPEDTVNIFIEVQSEQIRVIRIGDK